MHQRTDITLSGNGEGDFSFYLSPVEHEVFVVSDQHLLVFNAAAQRRLCLLDTARARHVIVNGDTFDEERARLHGRWDGFTTQDRDWCNSFFALQARTERVTLNGGNHDQPLRQFKGQTRFGTEIEDLVEFTDGRGRKTAVLHGDQFDHELEHLTNMARSEKGRSVVAALDHVHTGIVAASALADEAVRGMLGLRFNPYGALMKAVDTANLAQARFNSRNYQFAIENGYDVVVTGHTHIPGIRKIRKGDLVAIFSKDALVPRLEMARKDVLLVNSGDGVENFSAAALSKESRWEMVYYHDVAPKVGPAPEGLRARNEHLYGPMTDAVERSLGEILPGAPDRILPRAAAAYYTR